MSNKQTHRKSLWQFIIITSLSLIFFTIASPVYAQASLILDINIVNPTSGPVETGQVIEYVIDFSCASTTGPCGSLDIDFPIDTELELIEIIAPPGYIGSFSGTPPGVVTVNIVNDPVSNAVFEDGEAAQVTVRTRVRQDIDDSTIETDIVGTINNGSGPTTASTSTPDMTVNPPEGGWGVTKSTVSPAGGLGPAANGEATYVIEVCPTETLGVAQITQFVFSDRFPIGATVQSSNPGGFVLEDQLPSGTPDGTDDTIVWTINFAPPHTVDDGCVDVTYVLAFPDPPFVAGSDITNDAFVSATTDPNSTPFPNDADCPNCVGRDTNPGTIDNPSVTADGNKTGPGNAIVSPGISGGTSTFTIAWDLAQANVSGTGFTITDTFPVTDAPPSDGLPITEIEQITSATWPGGYQALLQISTVGTPAWTTIDTVDGSTATTYSAGGALPAIPPATNDLITGVRWQFIDDVPPAFATSTSAVIQFFVRDNMLATDYAAAPDSYRDYNNCIDLTGTYLDENGIAQPIPPQQDCTNLRISDDDVDGITNIQTSKSRDKSSVFPLEDIQFTLTLQITQEASGNLLNPAIQDILPFGMQITSWDEVEFVNTAGASEEILPYLRVDDVISGTTRRQRLLFYWDDTVTGSDGDTLVTQPTYAPSYVPTSYTCTNASNCQDPIANPTFANNYDYSLLAGTAPAAGNPISIAPPDTGVKTINIRFTAQPRLDSVSGDDDGNLIPSTNSTTVVTDSANVTCQTGTQSTEAGDDIDDDGNLTEVVCTTNASFQIREAAQMASQKWIRETQITPNLGFVNSQDLNDPSPACPTFTYNPISEGADVPYTRFPCVAQGAAGGSFEYLMRMQNTGLVNTVDYIMYDVLPHEPDFGVSEALTLEPRDTEFRGYLTGPIVEEDIPAGFTYVVEYNTAIDYNSCRPEMSSDSQESPDTHWQGTCDPTWVTAATIAGAWNTVTSFRIRQIGGVIPSGAELIFTAPMLIDGTPGEAETGEIAWNTFAQRFTNQPSARRLLTAEPRKVGIIVEEVHSVGNRVWIDDGIGGGIADNGRIDGAEIGVNGVTIELYETSDLTTPYATDVTRRDLGPNGIDDGGAGDDGEDGYYFFGNLPPGNYRVVVVGNEFDTGQELNGYISSSGNQSANANNSIDSIDTGQDQTGPANYIANGVRTNNFNLTRNSEATGETDVNDDDAGTDGSPPTNEGEFGRGENFEQDQDSDLTVDFGFFRPMSIGNRVWLDNGIDSGAPNGFNEALRNDGIINGDEAGIPNVTVLLYYDSNRDGVVNGSDTPQTTTTDAQGYYLFDGLAPGEYRVEIPAAEFAGGGDLEGLSSSFDLSAPVDADPDNDDHGIDEAVPIGTPVSSPTIILSPLGEPTSETTSGNPADGPDGRGTNGEIDENSDLTVDFGFVEVMSIGNRVWYDMGVDTGAASGFVPGQLNDGIINGTELGVPGVTVELYLASNLATPISTTVTDGTGYYLFDNLLRGDYVVSLPISNFASTEPLEGYLSSSDTAAPADADPDNDDHGIDVTPTVTTPINSPVITLSPAGETQADDEAVTGTANNPPPNIADNNSDLTVDFGFYKSMSIGNRVWLDNGISSGSTIISQYNDGILNGSEEGINGVTVNLYLATDLTTPISTTVTTNDGYYLFDGLGPNDYVVEIHVSNFTGPLLGLQSSFDASAPADSDPDNDDHGIDVAIPVTDPVRSPTITLTLDSETQIDDEAVTGTGSNFETDDNSDLTVDFGFVGVMSLGNRIWRDDGAITGGFDQTQFDNGILDGIESGISGAIVNLYFSTDLSTPISTTTTDGTGYYLFDNLPPGTYVVEIPASEFGTGEPLEGYFSSTDTVAPVDNDPDNDDHGIDPATPGTDPVRTPVITLAPATETQVDDEAVTGTDGGTAPFISDDNSDLTVDLGFFRPMSIGNRVWIDTDNVTSGAILGDGIRQTAESALGVGGVTVLLYTDDGSGGLGTLIASTTTTGAAGVTGANNGYYLFDRQGANQADPNARRLGPGDYIVHIPLTNFAAAAPLFGFLNSDGTNASGGDVLIDSVLDGGDENGVDATPGTVSTYPFNAGVSSTTITLAYDTEATTEEQDFDPAQAANYNGEGVEDDNGNLTVDFGFYQGLAIGNRVWFDGNRDGFIDANDRTTTPGNPGIAGVTVYLYRDSDGNGIPDGAFIASDTTDSEGYYIFDQLTSGALLVPDNYIVGIDPAEAANVTALADHVSTLTRVSGTTPLGTPLDSPTDNDDNGIDRRDIDPDPTIIYSESIALAHYDETLTESDADKETGVGDGNGVQDINSNLTVDFGFFVPMSIGNQVWLDTNNNALIDPTEDGINGVTVELFRDAGAGINPATDTPYRVTTTVSGTPNGNGYYIFDDLPEGDYVVRLAPANFNTGGALIDGMGNPYSSSESGGVAEAGYLLDNQTDNNDNGIDENLPQTNGIVSNVINLSYNTEPDTTADDVGDLNPAVGEGTFGERDNNAEMTIDFGVYSPQMSLGNRVYKDYDNNRILDGADVGVDGVVVNLFRDDDQNGIPDTPVNSPIATTTTANGGYYIFDRLTDGYYLVQVDENNFRQISAGGNATLLDFYSSQDKDASNNYVAPVDGDQIDSIDTGVDNPFSLATNPDLQANGIFSPTIQLVPSGEWIAEPDLGPEGDGEPNVQASNSDLTVDFGFYQPMSLGNFVWFDTDENGLYNGAESFIAGVQVELYRESDGTPGALNTATDTLVPVFDGTSYVNFDTTDDNGFYLFDNLPPGQYWVHIPANEFSAGQPLFNHESTAPENVPNPAIAPAPSSDSNDNGIVTGTEIANGVTSELITLGVIDPVNGSGLYIPNGTEPIGEVHKSNNPPTPADMYDGPASIGRYGELDGNSDITIDFGFTLADEASMSIGNRVWFDTNHNGLIDNAGDDNPAATGNPGIDGVTVLLYRADVSGNPIGDPIARDITANGGYYLFDVLDTDVLTAVGDGDGLGGPVTPGNYVVALPNSNFIGGAALENHTSTTYNVDNDGTLAPSTGVESGYSPLVDDNNHNGTVNATYGILSDLVTLTLQNERDDENDKDTSTPPDVGDGLDSTNTPIATNNSDLTVDFGFYIPMSLGNFVWVDTNNDGLYDDTTELPVDDGVIMALYAADGTTPIDDPANPGTPYQVTTTDGFYLFEGLPPGSYVVRVDLINFLPGGLLEGYTGSDDSGAGFQDNTDDDLNDNGFDADPTSNGGIPSGVIILEYNNEPTTEATSGNPADGPNGRGNNGELDENSNLTVDFGVYTSTYFSIGNRIWLDMGAGANENNGLHDTDELGIQNVIVNLFRDENDGAGGGPDGIPDSTTPFDTTTTDADGYYLFDALASGNYIVSVSPDNFDAGGVLRGYSPSPDIDPTESATDHASDQRDNTLEPDFGFYSNTYTLELVASEPTGEVDATPAGATQDPGVDPFGNPIPDNQSNLTVDFGFIRTLTLGNLVWFDIDNDGLYDDGVEVGISGVTVELYLNDGGTPDTFDGTNTLVDTEITDGNGFYLFENLDPDDYFLHIPNNPNWTASTGPLEGFQSSGPDATSPDTGDDNDNGIGTGDTNPTPGVTSDLLTLAFDAAPTGESTLSNNPIDGPEFRGMNNPPDNNSDLTWDFGFFLGDPMSIGNIVWIDDGNTTGTAGNGVRDGDEVGVDGVIVELYADSDGDGNPDTTTPIDTATTAGGGYYLFDGLPPGQYVVVITEDNFDGGVLNGYLSTPDGTTPDVDDNDNGIDNPTPANGGVSSDTIVLEVGTEPDADSEDVTGTGSNGETDVNSNLTVDFGFIAAFDWGDAPDSYGTDNDILTTVSPTGNSDQVGPSHRIVANLYLGAFVDDETNGVPVADGTSNNTNDPDGDGADGGFDEDGMDAPDFVAGTTVTVDVTARNQTGEDGTLIAWFDWNGDGVFDASEAYTVSVPNGTDGVVQLDVDVPVDAEDLTGGNTYARLRLTTDTITTSDFVGPMDSGEVEDYYITVLDPGLLINKTDGLNSIVAGEVNTYTIVIENSGDPRTGVTFRDDIQLATDTDANGYDPETIEWTCVAENGASCIAGSVSGTGSSDGPFAATATSVVINELIDLPRNGLVTYTITARVNEDAGLIPPGNITPLINVAQLPNESPPLEDEDETSIIFDPPYGVKTGTYLGDNIIRWTMTWYNPGATQTNVTIRDELGSGQTFPPTTGEIDLQCSGSAGTCDILGDDVVRWQGTMLTSTPNDDDDAIVISFNVLVEGDGRYNNAATLNYGTEETSASASVRIRDDREDDDDEEDTEDAGDGGFTQSAPRLAKSVDTPFTLPGATVVWTIEAVNDTNQTVTNVSITDDVPVSLSIIDGSSSSGEFTIDGQTVMVKQDSFAPGETITITLTTEISPDVAIPFAINNPAVLRCDCANESNAIATVISVLELPATGETPWWRLPLMLMILVGGVGTPLLIGYRRKTKHIS